MNASDAQKAIDQNPTNYSPELFIAGFWTYVTLPYDNSRGGNVLHYWPCENEKTHTTVFGTPGRSLGMEFVDRIAICGLTNENRYTPFYDEYWFRKLPKCKKCLKALQRIIDK